ncbi:MAG: hypothetical protein V4621_08290 [Pseudomonadota bacterium]
MWKRREYPADKPWVDQLVEALEEMELPEWADLVKKRPPTDQVAEMLVRTWYCRNFQEIMARPVAEATFLKSLSNYYPKPGDITLTW